MPEGEAAAARGWRAALLERCRYCGRSENLRATTRIALAVGLVLTAINEGDTLAAGDLGVGLAVKIPLNFIVPFIVSNLGLLAAGQETSDRESRP